MVHEPVKSENCCYIHYIDVKCAIKKAILEYDSIPDSKDLQSSSSMGKKLSVDSTYLMKGWNLIVTITERLYGGFEGGGWALHLIHIKSI